MMRILLPSLLAACTAAAAPLPQGWQDGMQALVEQWQAVDRETDAALESLAATAGEDDAADDAVDDGEPAAAAGDTQAYCRGGLMFDSAANTLIYLDRVWLGDERLQLSAEHRLYIKLPREGAENAPAEKKQQHSTAKVEERITSRAHEMPGRLRGGRISIDTTDAVADTAANTLLLTSPEHGNAILVAQGRNSILIHPGEGKPARLITDAEGNALISGAHISLRWVDDEGREGKMECAGGSVAYHAAEHTLHLPGHSSMEHPRGRFVCEKSLTVVLQPEDGADAGHGGGFLSQFAAMRFKGVKSVLLEDGGATLDEYSVQGGLVAYDAATGACSVSGKGSLLRYGANSISTDDAVKLHANGDIDISGDAVRITYERASQENPEKLLHGIMQGSAVHFSAAEGKVSAPGPLSIRDEELNFSCEGPMELLLRRAEKPRIRQREGMPNLAVAQYDGVNTLSASRSVRLAAKSAQGDVAVAGDAVEADLAGQSATVTAREGAPLAVQAGGFRAAAETSSGAHSSLQIAPDGDILLTGNHISIESTGTDVTPATVVAVSKERLSELHVNTAGDISLRGDDIGIETRDAEGQSVKAVCKESLALDKAGGRISTGSATRMQAAQGAFSANGPVTATLRQGPARPAPRNTRFAHLNYCFEGLEGVSTPQGGSIRTEQGSMQCTGKIEVAFGEGQAGLGSLQSARAEGAVVLAGKDSSGRVLRAAGDALTLDAAGVKTLTGNTVTLSDRYNTHTATGGASITIDARNNARISGATQRTTATGIHEQIKQQQDK